MIECELRSFITDAEHKRLITFFAKNAVDKGEESQVTYYFSGLVDLRIQKSDNSAKIWLKKGKIHDDQREEIELKIQHEDFDQAERLFLSLGYKVEIKWFRKRRTFQWDDCTVTLDDTKGYGKILELEQLVNEEKKDEAIARLKQKMKELNVNITPK